MNFLEKDLEDIIFENLDNNALLLKKHGLGVVNSTGVRWKKRQLHIGNYGTADIVTFNSEIHPVTGVKVYYINVYELKKEKLDIGSFVQAAKYANGIYDYLVKLRYDDFFNFNIYINIILIGQSFSLGGFTDLMKWINLNEYDFYGGIYVYTYDFRIDGLFFNSIDFIDYSLKEKGF